MTVLRELSVVPKVLIENDEPESIKEFVRLGVGVAILPAWSIADDARCAGTLRIQRLRTHCLHNYGLLWRTSGYQPKALNSLVESARRWREWWPPARFVSDPVA